MLNNKARQQSLSGPSVMQEVTVAVLPPILHQPFAPATGIGAMPTFTWEEHLKGGRSKPLSKPDDPEGCKSWIKRIFTIGQNSQNPDRPPFIMKKVPFDEWRRHYAKDKEGNYHGTHAPAEDCLLLPRDLKRWRLEEPTALADQWTRGKYALPAYGEEKEFEVDLPAYSKEDVERYG